MIINEDFWDNHSVEKDTERKVEIAEDEIFTIDLEHYYIRYTDSNFEFLYPVDITKFLKQLVNFIKNSPIFPDVSINHVRIDINVPWSSTDDFDYFDMKYNVYMNELPKTILGHQVEHNIGWDGNPGFTCSLIVNFTTSVELTYPKDVWQFFECVTNPKHDNMRTYCRVYPESEPYYFDKLNFYNTDAEGKMHNAKYFTKDSFVQIFDDGENLQAKDFLSLYYLFMNEDMLEPFFKYIESRNKTKEYPKLGKQYPKLEDVKKEMEKRQ